MNAATDELEAGGHRYRYREVGTSGEPVLLLHGFPETSHMWGGLMDHLAGAGYHCLAPDQRGYSPGARPSEVGDYRYEDLGADVDRFARARGWDRYHLVAHDWGAGAAWAALSLDPGPVVSFVSLSIPHYQAFAEAVWADPEEELYRGFLDLFAQADAEATLSAGDFEGLVATWSSSTPEEVQDYLSVFRVPGALTAALNWYRACDLHRRALAESWFQPVATPTLLLWGREDPYVRRMSIDLAPQYMRGEYRVVELDAGHWLVQEQLETVCQEVTAHLMAHPH